MARARGMGTRAVPGGEESQYRVYIVFGQSAVAGNDANEFFDDSLNIFYGAFFTVEYKRIAPSRDVRFGEGLFDFAQICIVEAVQEERFDAFDR